MQDFWSVLRLNPYGMYGWRSPGSDAGQTSPLQDALRAILLGDRGRAADPFDAFSRTPAPGFGRREGADPSAPSPFSPDLWLQLEWMRQLLHQAEMRSMRSPDSRGFSPSTQGPPAQRGLRSGLDEDFWSGQMLSDLLILLTLFALNWGSGAANDERSAPGSGAREPSASLGSEGRWGSSRQVPAQSWDDDAGEIARAASPSASDSVGESLASTERSRGAVGASARQTWGAGLVPRQFGAGLQGIQESAGCGPLAAIGVARTLGMNPDVQETFQHAAAVGWDRRGMNGPGRYVNLLGRMGISARLESGASSEEIASAVTGGRPVTISTPNHYFLAYDYNPSTGQFYVGNSGTAMRNGSEWMTLAEIRRLGGGMNGVVFLNE